MHVLCRSGLRWTVRVWCATKRRKSISHPPATCIIVILDFANSTLPFLGFNCGKHLDVIFGYHLLRYTNTGLSVLRRARLMSSWHLPCTCIRSESTGAFR